MNIGKLICHPYFNHWVCSYTRLNGRAGQYCNFSAQYIVKNSIYRGFTKVCGLTVLLGCFDFFIGLVLQVSGVCLL